MARTLYVKTKDKERLGLSRFGNAGPYPCISGMKEKYWGKNAYCVKCGTYVYKVDEQTYYRAMSL